VVYGDIGTSPLYAVRQCFARGVGVSEPRVFGVLSMIAWALTVVVTRSLAKSDAGVFFALELILLEVKCAAASCPILGARWERQAARRCAEMR